MACLVFLWSMSTPMTNLGWYLIAISKLIVPSSWQPMLRTLLPLSHSAFSWSTLSSPCFQFSLPLVNLLWLPNDELFRSLSRAAKKDSFLNWAKKLGCFDRSSVKLVSWLFRSYYSSSYLLRLIAGDSSILASAVARAFPSLIFLFLECLPLSRSLTWSSSLFLFLFTNCTCT